MKVTFYGGIAVAAMAAHGAKARFVEEDEDGNIILAQFDEQEFASDLASQLASTDAETMDQGSDNDSWAEVENMDDDEDILMTQTEGKRVKSAK